MKQIIFFLISLNLIADSGYVYPLMSPKMSSDYGTRVHPVKRVIKHHDGIDLAAPLEAPIRAIKDGFVIFSGSHGGYGNLIVIMHNNGVSSHYGHCLTLSMNVGEKVKSGEIIGTVGATGRVTGPHLHFEIRQNGKALNPESLLPDLAGFAQG